MQSPNMKNISLLFPTTPKHQFDYNFLSLKKQTNKKAISHA